MLIQLRKIITNAQMCYWIHCLFILVLENSTTRWLALQQEAQCRIYIALVFSWLFTIFSQIKLVFTQFLQKLFFLMDLWTL